MKNAEVPAVIGALVGRDNAVEKICLASQGVVLRSRVAIE